MTLLGSPPGSTPRIPRIAQGTTQFPGEDPARSRLEGMLILPRLTMKGGDLCLQILGDARHPPIGGSNGWMPNLITCRRQQSADVAGLQRIAIRVRIHRRLHEGAGCARRRMARPGMPRQTITPFASSNFADQTFNPRACPSNWPLAFAFTPSL